MSDPGKLKSRNSKSLMNSSAISNRLIEFPAKHGTGIPNDMYTTATYDIGTRIYRGDTYLKHQR